MQESRLQTTFLEVTLFVILSMNLYYKNDFSLALI